MIGVLLGSRATTARPRPRPPLMSPSPSSSSSSEENVSLLYLSSFLRRHGPPRNLAETAAAVRYACRGLSVVVEKKLGGRNDGLNDGIVEAAHMLLWLWLWLALLFLFWVVCVQIGLSGPYPMGLHSSILFLPSHFLRLVFYFASSQNNCPLFTFSYSLIKIICVVLYIYLLS